MKLVCYIKEEHEQLAILSGATLYDMDALHPELPSSMSMFLNYWEDYFPLAKNINESIEQGKTSFSLGTPVESVSLISPVPLPSSCRQALVPDSGTDEIDKNTDHSIRSVPFDFINHHSVQGHGPVSCMPDHLNQLDFEMSVAIVVSSHCRNITAAEAGEYIGGYMIMNKIVVHGKYLDNNITNVLGPWLVTPDELENLSKNHHDESDGLSLKMKCSVNDEILTEVNFKHINQTFAKILESCAYGTGLQPGDVIGTGSINKGYFHNHNLVENQNNPGYLDRWLQEGDKVVIEMEGLGISEAIITAEESNFSLNMNV